MAGRQDTFGVPLRFDPKLGSCAKAGVDPDIFFPQGTSREVASKTAQAKAMCSQCPMIEACLLSAMDNAEWGIWGGSTMKERQTMRRSRKQIDLHLRLLMEGKYRVSSEDENTIIYD